MLALSIVSPIKNILETECKQVTIPTQSGLITILPQHAPLMSLLSQGEVVAIDKQGRPTHVLVSGGFLNVEGDKVNLLVDYGIHSDELDEKVILEAQKRAEKAILESKTEESLKTARAALLHSNLQLQLLTHRGKNHNTTKA